MSQKSGTRLTEKQGHYLAFIHTYSYMFGQPPAEADIQRHFRVSPPSVRVELASSALEMASQRRSFTEDYKRQAVELVVSSGRSVTSVAKELGLRDSVLRRWVENLRPEPTSAAQRPITQAALMSADQAEENERLRMERDILKNCPAPWRACAG